MKEEFNEKLKILKQSNKKLKSIVRKSKGKDIDLFKEMKDSFQKSEGIGKCTQTNSRFFDLVSSETQTDQYEPSPPPVLE